MNPANAWLLLSTPSPGVDVSPSGFGSLKPSDVAIALRSLDRPRFLLGMASLVGDRNNLHELVTSVKLEIILPMAEFGNWTIKRGSESYRRMAALAVFEFLQGQSKRCFVCHGLGRYRPPSKALALADEERRRYVQAMRRLNRLQWRANELSKQLVAAPDAIKRKRLKRILRHAHELAQWTETTKQPEACVTCNGSGELVLEGWHRAWLMGFNPDHYYRVWQHRYEPLQPILMGWQSDCLTHVRERLHVSAA